MPLGAGILVIIFATASCATAPERQSLERPVHFLPSASIVLGKINAKENGELFNKIIETLLPEDTDIGKAFERTENVFFSYNTKGVDKKIISIVVQGRFPKGITKAFIKKGDGWEKRKGEVPWWHNTRNGMQVAVPEGNLIFLSGGLMPEMIERYLSGAPKKIDYEALKEIEVSDLVLYMSDPASGFIEGLPVDTGKFPLTSLWFTLFKRNESYLMSGVFVLTDEKQAKAMAMLSKIFMVGWFRQNKLSTIEALKETMKIEPVKSSVRMYGVYLDTEEVLRMILSLVPEGGMGAL